MPASRITNPTGFPVSASPIAELTETLQKIGPPRSSRRPGGGRASGSAGYTLLELLVVMGIIAILTAIATPQVIGYFNKAKTQSVQLQIQNINTALEMYYMENGNYPSSEQGLRALVEAPPDAPRWNGPYLKQTKNLLDPWGHPFQYDYPTAHGDYQVFSAGPSGKLRQPGG